VDEAGPVVSRDAPEGWWDPGKHKGPLLGSLAFLPILLLLALPWVSFSIGCTSGISPQSGFALMVDQDILVKGEVDTTAGRDQVSGTVHIPAQWPVRLVVICVAVGASLFWLRRWPGRLTRSLVAIAGALLAAWTITRLNEGHFSVTGHQPEIDAGLGAGATLVGFCLVALINVTLPERPRMTFWKGAGYLALLHVLAVPASIGLAGIGELLAGEGGPLGTGASGRPGDAVNAAIPGEILYIDERGCVQQVAASGLTQAAAYCFRGVPYRDELERYTPIRTAEGALAFLRPVPHSGQLELITLDPRTGEPILTGRLGHLSWGFEPLSPSGELAHATREYVSYDYYTLYLGSVKIAELTEYVVSVTWSPDDQWMLLHARPSDEYWVFSRDGTQRRVAVPDASNFMNASWWIEGVGNWPLFVESGVLETIPAVLLWSEEDKILVNHVVRDALAYAAEGVELTFLSSGFGKPAPAAYSPELARRLLAESGFADGRLTLTLRFFDMPVNRRAVEALARSWTRELGVQVSLVPDPGAEVGVVTASISGRAQ
jgi:hypothetical protein